MKLRTPRLLLRPVSLADVDHWYELDQQPGVLRFIASRPRTREDVTASIRRQIAAAQLHHDYGFLSAFDASQRFVGWFHLRPGPEGDIFNPELGYRLRPEFWGQGLATEGSRALLEAAFIELGAVSIHAEAMAANAASRAVMERLGMQLEASFDWPGQDRIPGWEQGEVRYRIGREVFLGNWVDVRATLHQMQQAALARHRLGVPSGATDLARLRAVGMELARVEVDAIRASGNLVAHLAELGGVELGHSSPNEASSQETKRWSYAQP